MAPMHIETGVAPKVVLPPSLRFSIKDILLYLRKRLKRSEKIPRLRRHETVIFLFRLERLWQGGLLSVTTPASDQSFSREWSESRPPPSSA
jgi:hypothetical protein